ncbi:MAG: hypothetical protein V3W32_04805 [Gemmatimonadota bacterium]
MRILSVTLFAFVLAACASSTTGNPPAGAPDPGVSQSAGDASGAPADDQATGDDQAAGDDQASEADADQQPQDRNPHIAGDMEASSRVTDIELSPSPIVLTRGDTIRVEGHLTDADGNRVTGARWGIGAGGPVDIESIKDSIPDSYLFRGASPGSTEIYIVLPKPTEEGVEWTRIASFDVVVNDWPVARVDVDPPAFGTYAGSVFGLEARAITTHETEHATAKTLWSSSNPEIVSVTPDGIATFRTPGQAVLTASAEGLDGSLTVDVKPNPVRSVQLEADASGVRTGDVVHLTPNVSGSGSRTLDDVNISYSVSAIDGPADGAEVFGDATFVANSPGAYRVMVTAGGQSATVVVEAAPREARRVSQLVGRGAVAHVATSDLWVFQGRDGRDYAYTGTHAQGGGERMYAWDVTDASSPVLTDSVVVDARVVNDVKVNADASWAMITREGASSRRNGIIVLDLADPAHPTIIAELTDSLTAGIHNLWINGDVVYAVNDGTSAMHIIEMADPTNPRHIGRWEVRPGEENKSLHDVWAENGLAYLSYWDDGLIVLDVGDGIEGGTPREPKFVSQYQYRTYQPEEFGNTHTAYRYGDYVFTGDEIFGCGDCVNGPRGYIHVVDVSDIENPKQVARYEVPEAGTHNIWVEDGLLYIAYYQGGLRVVDVSGELRGDLYKQGREVAWFQPAGEEGEAVVPNAPLAWGPQPHKGNIFLSDMNSGLWVIQVEPPEQPLVP